VIKTPPRWLDGMDESVMGFNRIYLMKARVTLGNSELYYTTVPG